MKWIKCNSTPVLSKELDSQATALFFFFSLSFYLRFQKNPLLLFIKLFALKISADVAKVSIYLTIMCCTLATNLENIMACISAVYGIALEKRTMKVTAEHSAKSEANMLPPLSFAVVQTVRGHLRVLWSSRTYYPQPWKGTKSWHFLSNWLLAHSLGLISELLF